MGWKFQKQQMEMSEKHHRDYQYYASQQASMARASHLLACQSYQDQCNREVSAKVNAFCSHVGQAWREGQQRRPFG